MPIVPSARPMGPPPYWERPAPAALADRVACVWARPAGAARTVLVIPDGCVDLIWRTDGHLLVVGPDRGPVEHVQPADAGYVGVRLRPGTAGATLGVDMSELLDRQVDATDLWGAAGGRLADRVAAARNQEAQLAALVAAVAQRADDRDIDPDVAAVAADLTDGTAGVADAVLATGVSERHLRRRFHAQVGYGPKTFDRVMRLQRFLAGAQRPMHVSSSGGARPGLAALAAEAGYADQAHLTRDCRSLTGRTPAALLAASR